MLINKRIFFKKKKKKKPTNILEHKFFLGESSKRGRNANRITSNDRLSKGSSYKLMLIYTYEEFILYITYLLGIAREAMLAERAANLNILKIMWGNKKKEREKKKKKKKGISPI